MALGVFDDISGLLRSLSFPPPLTARRGDIHAIQPRAFDAGGLSVAQIVDDDNAFAGLMERMDDVGTDVSAPTGNENCHVCPFVTASITIGIRDD